MPRGGCLFARYHGQVRLRPQKAVARLVCPKKVRFQDASNWRHFCSNTVYTALMNLVKPREGAEAESRYVVLGGKRGNRADPW
jgi:hypothetical protein